MKKHSKQWELHVQRPWCREEFGVIKEGKENYCDKSMAQIKSISKTSMKEDDSCQPTFFQGAGHHNLLLLRNVSEKINHVKNNPNWYN